MTSIALIAVCACLLSFALGWRARRSWRPPVEVYARATLNGPAGLTIEPGLEWRRGEDLGRLSAQLRLVAADAARLPSDGDRYRTLNDDMRGAIERLWPGRAWFVEIHGADGQWTQQYQPYGVPRNR